MKHLFSALFAASALFFTPSVEASDYSVTAASVVASSSASRVTGVAGTTVTAGQAVYLDSNNVWQLADANASATTAKIGGIALHGASSGQPLTVAQSDPAFTPGFTVAAGDVVILSATAGGLAPVADAASGYYVSVVGIGIGNNKIKFQITRSDVVK